MVRVLILLSLALFIISLFLPVYAEKPDLQAYWALMGGWMVGANDIPTAISWFANVTFIVALILIIKRKKPKATAALIFGVLSVILALCFLGAGQSYLGTGVSQTVGKLSVGSAFYPWVGSFILISIAAYLKIKAIKAKNTVSNAEVVDQI